MIHVTVEADRLCRTFRRHSVRPFRGRERSKRGYASRASYWLLVGDGRGFRHALMRVSILSRFIDPSVIHCVTEHRMDMFIMVDSSYYMYNRGLAFAKTRP